MKGLPQVKHQTQPSQGGKKKRKKKPNLLKSLTSVVPKKPYTLGKTFVAHVVKNSKSRQKQIMCREKVIPKRNTSIIR